uniref:Bifunctional NAD(P)H-hydrate repair enzyme n=1 Tax=uncultured Nocardioidaceae bacterium TaxID=253824 RepID=A0A6J4MGA4_9ACTN|nr:MAG: NAD(P)H-hydrate epimerase / ADP-dependent (S)-NAD(P)H-hydrate dehydratase [uncultured Nocardioidaceae bacterium]
MTGAHTVADVRTAEEVLLAQLPDGALMQRAAAGLAHVVAQLLDSVYGARVGLLVGSGNNGGDGLFAGARLCRRGVRVEAVLIDPTRVHADGLAAFRASGGRVVDRLGGCDLVLDAVLGIGGSAGLRDDAWRHVEDLSAPVVAVDVPSGIDVDGGTLPAGGRHVRAAATVTFGTAKIGLLAGPAADCAGAVRIVDIGLGPHLPPPSVRAVGSHDARRLVRIPGPADHKYTRGVVGVAAGSPAYTGAGLLSVAGASCGLAGMVRYVGPEEVAGLVRAAHPEVVVGEGRVQAWVVGSGGGDGAERALRRAYEDGVAVVIDADALQHVDGPPPVPALLTPHAGELAAMLGAARSAVEADPLSHVRQAARTYGCTVLLKGARTLVCGPGGVVHVNTTGTDWLATAGAGDVLAGLCGALAANSGGDLAEVGAVATWLHGSAAVRAAGPLTAGAVAAALPAVIATALGLDHG